MRVSKKARGTIANFTPLTLPFPQGEMKYGGKFATARMCALKGLGQSVGLQVGSVFFFFGSLFLFAAQQKEKVNKRYNRSGFVKISCPASDR